MDQDLSPNKTFGQVGIDVDESISSPTTMMTTIDATSQEPTVAEELTPDPMDIYYVTENSHIVIPLISFVFGFPVLVIIILCLVQQRNKCHYKKQQELYLQAQRLSTVSTLQSGMNSGRERANSTFSANGGGGSGTGPGNSSRLSVYQIGSFTERDNNTLTVNSPLTGPTVNNSPASVNTSSGNMLTVDKYVTGGARRSLDPNFRITADDLKVKPSGPTTVQEFYSAKKCPSVHCLLVTSSDE